MEMSSPLAAMHQPSLPAPWGYRPDLPPSRPLFAAHSLAPKTLNFNFRDISMKRDLGRKKVTGEYFTLQPHRGSSPTASLAADMSSNLHVDQSPQLATPRRSLFTTNMFQLLNNRVERTTTPPLGWEGVTTPPVPSSSPNFVPDSMDISPLPHKAPFSLQPVPSPSPAVTSTTDADMLSPTELPTPPQFPAPGREMDVPRPLSATERRKPNLLRSNLFRSKNYSTNTVSFKARESNLPTFKFGAGIDGFSTTNAPSLDECFAPSPPQERRPLSNPSIGYPKPRSFCFNTNLSRANGSPLGANVRKHAPPRPRPSKMRRSLSMFEHPGHVMNAKQDNDSYTPSGLQAVMDVDDTTTLKLPHFVPANEPDSLPRITNATLIDVLNGDYDDIYAEKVVVDCRFEYEYTGGHIADAVNFCEKELLAERLFSPDAACFATNTLLILHCEYSAHRAPLMAKFVRQEDRRINCHRYPHLTYPEIYILDGGYSSFYGMHRNRCYPRNYLRMDAEEHQDSCERGMNKLRQRSKLNRAQTFAFGQQSCQMEDSPTAVGRSKSGFPLGDEPFKLGRIGTSRRMASY